MDDCCEKNGCAAPAGGQGGGGCENCDCKDELEEGVECCGGGCCE